MRRTLPLLSLALALAGCSGRAPIQLPPTVSAQLPVGNRMDETRGVLLARIVVTTEGEPGFGPITNPLFVQFRPGFGDEKSSPTVTLPSQDALVFGTPSQRVSVWRYQAPGLLAMSIAPGSYDGMGIAYPDYSEKTATPSSIPVPSRGLTFAPVEVRAGEVVYIGDIDIRQQYGSWDYFAGNVEVTYAVRDNADATVAEFHRRYPTVAEVKVEERIAKPTVEYLRLARPGGALRDAVPSGVWAAPWQCAIRPEPQPRGGS